MESKHDPDVLPMWTIYDHPSDFPHDYVARQWLVSKGGTVATDIAYAHPNLTVLRAAVRAVLPGATCLPRDPKDDPAVVETWV